MIATKRGVELDGSANSKVANAPHIIMIPTMSKTMDRRNFPNPFICAYLPAFRLFYTTLVIDSNTLSYYPLAEGLEGKANGRMGESTNNGGGERSGI